MVSEEKTEKHLKKKEEERKPLKEPTLLALTASGRCYFVCFNVESK